DLAAGGVVFLVALTLCLGVAFAAGAPLFSGILSGIIGGIVVGTLSGSQTSVSGPSPAQLGVVTALILSLGSFQAFLLAVVVAGVIQIALGLLRAGFLSAFVPSSVIKGLLGAVGLILILKQIPHLLGHDSDPEGDMSFVQPDHENTFSEITDLIGEIHLGAAVIGILSFLVLLSFDRFRPLRKAIPIPPPLIVVLLGAGLTVFFSRFGADWRISSSHLVQVPVAQSLRDFLGFLTTPDFSRWKDPAIYTGGLTIALVATLETLMNLEAIDKIDPKQRVSPASRELVAQGVGNTVAGLIGGIPLASVIVRSSLNINAGAQTKLAAIIHGILLLICVMFLPKYLNMIPISCLAAILLTTGIKLFNPKLIVDIWHEGRYQFLPFAITLAAIVLTDLLFGVLIGLAVSITFILNSNLRRPLKQVREKHLGDEVLHIELASQVSFLNRAALERALRNAPRGTHVLLDARNTDYIDPDILSLIREYKENTAPIQGVRVSLRGFRPKYQLQDETQYVDHSTRELQEKLTSVQVLQILREGNERFRTGHRLTRDLARQVHSTSHGQHPLAVVLSCIDSRSPAELLMDVGLGDIFSVRVAGNVISPKVLGSMEYSCAVAGAKLIVVLGHTKCGAVTAAVDLADKVGCIEEATGCQHLAPIVEEIQKSLPPNPGHSPNKAPPADKHAMVDQVARRNVQHSVQQIVSESRTISRLVEEGRLAVVGAMYDVGTGEIEFLQDQALGLMANARQIVSTE
ncbi:MAG: bifunctional SulP family inorganic anion transporter/carbonic anhydrase, partial [Pirellulales bacterium]